MLAPDQATVRVWALTQVTDPNGNYISYTWNNWGTDYDYAIAEIDYTGSAHNSTYNSIKFAYGTARTDVVPMYQAGAKILSTSLLSSITVNHGTTGTIKTVWTYTLGYNQVASGSWWSGGAGGSVWHNQLATLLLCDISGTNCLPTMKFTWQGGPSTWGISSTARSFSVGRSLMSGDFNADGIIDILAYDTSSAGDIYLGDTSGNFPNNTVEQAKYDYWQAVYPYSENAYNAASWFSPYQGNDQCCLVASPSVLDMDGDGFSDIVLPVAAWLDRNGSYSQWEIGEALRNNQAGTVGQINSDFSLYYNAQVIGDFDGDNRDDLFNWCGGATCPSGTLSLSTGAYLSNGAGYFNFNQNLALTFPNDASVAVGDFDGSGCSGLLQQNATKSEAGELYYFCELPNGKQGVVSTQITNWGWGGSGNTIVLGDFNGDSKTDILVANSNGATVYLSTGTALQPYTVCGSGSGCTVSGSNWYKYKIVAADFNGDGKTDVALIDTSGASAHAIYLSTGTDFVAGPTIANSITCNFPAVADWNSDGASDLWLQHSACSSSDTEYTFSYTPELLQKVDDGNGKVTTVSYDRINKGGPLYTNGTNIGANSRYLDGPIYVVSQIATSDGIGGTRSWSYSYQGLEKNLQGLGVKGFDEVTVTDNLTGIVKAISYYNWWPLYGYPEYETVTCCGVQPTVTLADITYNNNYQNLGGYYFTLPSITYYSGNDLDGTAWPSTKTTFGYDSTLYGNLYQKTYINNSDCNQGNCFTSETTILYNYDTSDWVVDLPTSSSTTNTPPSGTALTRAMSFTEGNGNGSGEPWQIVTAVVEPGAGDTTTLNISYGYDNWGNLASTGYSGSQIESRSSSTTYDSNGEFPVTTTNALSQSETWSIAPYPNQTNTLVDLNGLTTTWKTDTFGRPSNITKPDSSQVNVAYYYCNQTPPYTCPTNGAFLAATTHTGPGGAQNAPTTVVFYDSLGRVVAQDTQSFDGSNFNRVNTNYDTYGNVLKISRPHVAGSTAKWIQYSYDVLGRVTDVLFPDSTDNKYTYDALTTTVTLDVGHLNETTTTARNPEGLVASVTDSNKGVTSYAYDAFGNPLTVTSPDQTQVTNKFDTLGRKIKSTDPDMGIWLYSYDNLGELLKQQSPIESVNNPTSLGLTSSDGSFRAPNRT